MNLVYMDDSGTDEGNPVVLYGALVIKEEHFQALEIFADVAVEHLIPAERARQFEEFHAFDLFRGSGVFEGIPQDERFGVIRFLLSHVAKHSLVYVYAAVDKKKLQGFPLLGSANPADVAFRQCVLGVENWVRSQHTQSESLVDPQSPWSTPAPPFGPADFANLDLCFYVLDDTKDVSLKKLLRASYRTLRRKRHLSNDKLPHHRLWHAHDDLYFGDSRDSVGIQMTDICNYFLLRHLKGMPDTEGFFASYAAQVHCARAEPEWSQYQSLFRSHDACVEASGAPASATLAPDVDPL